MTEVLNYETLKAKCAALADKCDRLEYNLGNAIVGEQEALQRVNALAVENQALKDVLESICCRDNEPEYHDCGMGCGLEDRGITDRYAAMEHGWESAMERIYEEVIPFIEDLPETPATDAALAAIRNEATARALKHLCDCQLISATVAELKADELREAK